MNVVFSTGWNVASNSYLRQQCIAKPPVLRDHLFPSRRLSAKTGLNTVFRQINAPGAEAENDRSTLPDGNEINSVNSWIPEYWVLKSLERSVQEFLRYGQVKSNVGGRVYSSRHVYSAKHGMYVHVLIELHKISRATELFRLHTSQPQTEPCTATNSPQTRNNTKRTGLN